MKTSKPTVYRKIMYAKRTKTALLSVPTDLVAFWRGSGFSVVKMSWNNDGTLAVTPVEEA